ncbi:exodeoxyribonuclease VII large subunit [Desulfobaculum xiamenense]|uniref:Exodeoxyribonuclease 7 large subunit n=1 Tax=Desulfobaculum xiamenense TaxID=995050 RepID=A0A846QSN9_9BACT|nr:exodeoxyribonuclease VII large subunit [Desulfobaculum xiamenense]
MPHIFGVSELTFAVRDVLESQFPFVWVRGQVGNLTRPGSGHIYFTLRDENAQLSVVWFRGSQRIIERGGVDPLTGEVHENGYRPSLAEGQEVVCAGRLNVYAPRGQYQLVAELVQDQGVGRLHAEFEALKAKLAGLGYFDPSRKMSLPWHPARVAVITAPTGAAIRDFLRIAAERGWGAQIRIHPVLVQGDQAPAQIAHALAQVDADDWADVVVLIRGGGSLEDLWAFNTEPVADAIFNCRLPVLSGVGHEVDTTIADFVADLRAATPSHAAQLLWPERAALVQQVDALDIALQRAAGRALGAADERLGNLEKALAWLSPARRVEHWLERFTDAARALEQAMRVQLDRRAEVISRAETALPRAFGPEALARRRDGIDALVHRLELAAAGQVRTRAQALALAEARLDAVDPEKPLTRGYGLVTVERTGRFLRSVDEIGPGERVTIRVRDGRVGADVTDTVRDIQETE